MPTQQHGRELDDFLSVYTALTERFSHDENARALMNEVAAELLAGLRRNGNAPDGRRTRRYFLWLLARKGFNFRGATWRDVDLGLRRCGNQRVIHLPLDEFVLCAGEGFSFDPRGAIIHGILLRQTLGALSARDQELLTSRVIEGQTLEEIANRLKITPQGVKKRLDRLYSRMRHYLTERQVESSNKENRSI